jgi:hypothetical protein
MRNWRHFLCSHFTTTEIRMPDIAKVKDLQIIWQRILGVHIISDMDCRKFSITGHSESSENSCKGYFRDVKEGLILICLITTSPIMIQSVPSWTGRALQNSYKQRLNTLFIWKPLWLNNFKNKALFREAFNYAFSKCYGAFFRFCLFQLVPLLTSLIAFFLSNVNLIKLVQLRRIFLNSWLFAPVNPL